MKKILGPILLASCLCGVLFILFRCTSKKNIDNVVNPITEQITIINSKLDDLKALDIVLEDKITSLETKATSLESDLEELETSVDTKLNQTKIDLEEKINNIKTDIELLKEKDIELEEKITSLEESLETAINDTKLWIESNYVTIESSEELENEIIRLISTLETRVEVLEISVETLESSLTRLKEQVEEHEKELEDLINRINCLEGNHSLQEEFTYTWSDDYSKAYKTKNCLIENCRFFKKITSESTNLVDKTLTATFGEDENISIDITTIKNVSYLTTIGKDNNLTYIVYDEIGLKEWNSYAQINTSTNLILAKDITLMLEEGATSNWTSLGTSSSPYKGYVNGNGFSISNLTINQTLNDAGFIGYADLGRENKSKVIAENIIFKNVSINNTASNTGSLFGYLKHGRIEYCHVKSGTINGYDVVGGLIGYHYYGDIIACSNSATLTSQNNLGGIVSKFVEGNLIGSYNTGTLEKKYYPYYSGGILYSSTYGKLEACYNTGESYYAFANSHSSSKLIKNNYWSSSQVYAYKESDGDEGNNNCTKINNNETEWLNAAEAMNPILKEYGYKYIINTNESTKEFEPLVIVKINK
jgi:chaperonin cofactor prefoldin